MFGLLVIFIRCLYSVGFILMLFSGFGMKDCGFDSGIKEIRFMDKFIKV